MGQQDRLDESSRGELFICSPLVVTGNSQLVDASLPPSSQCLVSSVCVYPNFSLRTPVIRLGLTLTLDDLIFMQTACFSVKSHSHVLQIRIHSNMSWGRGEELHS